MKTAFMVFLFGCAGMFAECGVAPQAQINSQSESPCEVSADLKALTAKPQHGTTRRPSFSIHPGQVAAGIMVTIHSSTPHAAIFFTTDGWTPSLRSQRYIRPIIVDATTHLQAIAIAPHKNTSLVGRSDYIVKGPPPAAAAINPLVLPGNNVLPAGTRVQLVTGAYITSRSARVGDSIPIELAQEIRSGDRILVPKGTEVKAIVNMATPASSGGMPGMLAFAVQSLTLGGTVVRLNGGEFQEGADHFQRTVVYIIPIVNAAALTIPGDDATIVPGMPLTAYVAKDTTLYP
jgi:hypothetical protein